MGLVHPAYLSELGIEAEGEDYGPKPQKYVGKKRLAFCRPRINLGSLDFFSSKYLPFLAGVGVGLISVSLIWLPGRSSNDLPAAAPSLSEPSVPVSQSEYLGNKHAVMGQEVAVVKLPTKLEADVELLKRIVAGLVEMVQGLSQRKDTSDLSLEASEAFPFPVQVTSDKAHLRKSADRASPSIVEVGKDTTLMAFDGTDKWLKVSTPRGEDAWISRSVVVAKKLG